MTAGERIKALIKYKGLNVKTFSEFCGYDRPQVLYDLIKGKTRNVSAAMSMRILESMPEVNRVWLLTGEGEMLTDVPLKPLSHPIDQVKSVPLIPISAIAGPISVYYESGVDLRNCQQVPAPTPLAEMAIPISGDSMEPLFPDGSTVYIKRINEASFIPWGHPMVIDTENGVFIKNVMPDDGNDGYIWAESTNPRYPRMHIPKKSIMGMYRVLGIMKPFTTM